MPSFGRRKILTSVSEVTAANVVDVLKQALPIHNLNRSECQHLMDYYKGKQAVLSRIKKVRPEINNKIVINIANEIVNFKVSYLLSDPITYISRGTDEQSDGINQLNDYMLLNNKAARDKELADDFSICGTAYRMVLPNKSDGEDEPPFKIYTLDPRCTFIVYNSGLGEPPICSVSYVTVSDVLNKNSDEIIYSVYTPTTYFEIKNDKIDEEKTERHIMGGIPVIEYCNNNARLGSFEVVETLLDAINTLASNRVDATEQFVQALMVFLNCDIDSDQYDEMRKKGAVKIKSGDGVNSDIKLLTADMKQADQQVLTDALYHEIQRIVGLPTQGMENTSDSSNNGAMIVKNGWSQAEARAKDTELLFRESERNFLKLVLKICRDVGAVDIKLSSIMPKFTRRSYENSLVKSQILTTMLTTPQIAPRLAFEASGLFLDPESAYSESMKYFEENKPPEDIPVGASEEIIVTENN
jgi:SPP1 family phage portal protein